MSGCLVYSTLKKVCDVDGRLLMETHCDVAICSYGKWFSQGFVDYLEVFPCDLKRYLD